MKKDIMIKLKDLDVKEVLQRDIRNFSNGSHVILNLKHRGKKAVVLVLK